MRGKLHDGRDLAGRQVLVKSQLEQQLVARRQRAHRRLDRFGALDRARPILRISGPIFDGASPELLSDHLGETFSHRRSRLGRVSALRGRQPRSPIALPVKIQEQPARNHD